MGTNLAFAQGLPLLTRPSLATSTKCVRRHRASASATASPTPATTSAVSAAANGGTLVSGNTVEPLDVVPQLDLGQVTSLADVSQITQLADEFDLADLRIESGGVTIEITREGGRGFVDGVLRDLPQPVAAPAIAPSMDETELVDDFESSVEAEEQSVPEPTESESTAPADPNEVYDSDFVVKSNRVGYFFSGARNKPPLVNVGDHVGFNQPVCIIEQLGQQYVYLSEVSGTVTKIFVEDGDAVMFDDQVMVIRPD